MATHSSILTWRIPWTEDPGGLQSRGPQSRSRPKGLGVRALGVLPCENMRFFISPIPEDILSIDTIQGQNLPTSGGNFCFQVRVIEPVLRGFSSWEPVNLPLLGRVVPAKEIVWELGIRKEEKLSKNCAEQVLYTQHTVLSAASYGQ